MKAILQSLANPSLLRLAGYLTPHKGKIASAVFCMVLAGVSSSLIAKLLGLLTDHGFYKQDGWIIAAAPIGLMAVAVMHGAAMYLSNVQLGRVSQAVLVTLRKELFRSIIRWPEETLQKHSAGAVSSKFVFEANFALTGAAKSFIILVRDSVQVAALSVLLFWHNLTLALVSLVIAPLVALLLRWISRRIKSVMAGTQANIAEILERVRETYTAADTVKLAGSYDAENRRFLECNERIRALMLEMIKVSTLGTPVTQLICMAGVAVVLAAAMWQTQAGMLTTGDFVTFLAALLLLLPPLRHLAGVNASIVMMSIVSESIFSALDEPTESAEGGELLKTSEGRIAFEGVSLRYPGASENALTDITLTAKKGDVVALVGPSGAGKTSMVSLLLRLREPTEGRITIDGIDVKTLSLASLREQFALVSQDVFIFDDSIRANILYGTPDATEEEIAAAVEGAALTDFIASLPQGLDTPAGEAGEKLSGGQRQRIAIARALIRNAPVLILDEATSALDSFSEDKVKTALRRLMDGRTTFIVAHRLTALEDATKIAVLENGRIVECGTRDALMKANGRFAELCRLQSLGGKS